MATRAEQRRGRVGLLGMFVLGASSFGCQDLGRFSTKPGEAYCGSIVTAPFIREGFDQRLRMRVELDAESLTSRPGTLTTDDAETPGAACAPLSTFDSAQLRVTDQVLSDPLSMLHFGDGRERNFIAWADSTCRGSFLTVVSLMKDETVEVRLLAPSAAPVGSPADGAFAVFPLEKQQGDCGF